VVIACVSSRVILIAGTEIIFVWILLIELVLFSDWLHFLLKQKFFFLDWNTHLLQGLLDNFLGGIFYLNNLFNRLDIFPSILFELELRISLQDRLSLTLVDLLYKLVDLFMWSLFKLLDFQADIRDLLIQLSTQLEHIVFVLSEHDFSKALGHL